MTASQRTSPPRIRLPSQRPGIGGPRRLRFFAGAHGGWLDGSSGSQSHGAYIGRFKQAIKNNFSFGLDSTTLACAAAHAEAARSLARELREADQALLVAVHNGGRAVWESYTTPDFAYVAEGEMQRRAAFLDGLEPDGSSGLRIADYRVEQLGDTAIVLHVDDVPGAALDARPKQQYLMTETGNASTANGSCAWSTSMRSAPTRPPCR